MAQKSPPDSRGKSGKSKAAADREARLKQALKANMARRKAQARARAQDDHTGTAPDAPDKGQ
ncbi:hypothetical protein ABMC89_13510 [Sulfitobacter sp. HNIBRBA3233]|uniref:hypothetical protein n=1 Tax=Sulfitobacter marinivivus TaxID=3158558 RepID=UPI0032DF4E8B